MVLGGCRSFHVLATTASQVFREVLEDQDKTKPAIRRSFFPFVLGARGKGLSPKKKMPDRG